MKLPLLTLAAGVLIGLAFGGRLGNLLGVKLRWGPMALIGLAMQGVPIPEDLEGLGVLVLVASFVPLGLFVGANIRLPGAALLMLGLLMNFAVISANQGMPVSRHALIASGQAETLDALLRDGGVRHHLATQDDVLRPLGDVIPVGGFVGKAVSPGDLAAYAGGGWMLVALMRRRRGGVKRVRTGPSPPAKVAEAAAR
ncbi:MAG: DUF5317 family protein [Actinomycetota bacterium]